MNKNCMALMMSLLFCGCCRGGTEPLQGDNFSEGSSFAGPETIYGGTSEISGETLTGSKSTENLVMLETLIMEASDKPDNYSVRMAGYNAYGDLDGDGKNELLAVYGSDEDNIADMTASSVFSVYGELWFADDEGAVQLYTESEWWVYDLDPIIKMDDEWLMCIDQANGSKYESFVSFCYRMTDGRPERMETYHLGSLTYTGNRDFTGISLAYDSGRDDLPTGKPYWFYIPEDSDMLREYGCREMTSDEFSGYEGSEEALDKISMEQGEVINILYRDNGIININFKTDAYGDTMYMFRSLEVTADGSLEDITPPKHYGRYIPYASGNFHYGDIMYDY